MFFSTIIDYVIALKLVETKNERNRNYLLYVSLIVNLGVLGFFKYFNFFVESFDTISSQFGYKLDYLHLNIILPVGISFYTLQTLSYTIDVYKKRLQPSTNIIDFGLYVSFFPQLVAGPIERAGRLLPQLSKKLTPTKLQVKQGVVLIAMGLFRKVLIGDSIARVIDPIFSDINSYKSIELILALFLFTIQIYSDFSGYSHMARGVAKLLGVDLVKNFNQPYLSSSFTEFWERWHISLSEWLRDYLYIPLGGNRNGETRTYINLFLTMLIGGLWHGASWSFLIWGGLHGFFLLAHRFYNQLNFSAPKLVAIPITFLLTVFSMLFARLSIYDIITYSNNILIWESSEYAWIFIQITLSFLLVSFSIDFLEYKTKRHTFILEIKQKGIQFAILITLFTFCLLYMLQANPTPFFYFAF